MHQIHEVILVRRERRRCFLPIQVRLGQLCQARFQFTYPLAAPRFTQAAIRLPVHSGASRSKTAEDERCRRVRRCHHLIADTEHEKRGIHDHSTEPLPRERHGSYPSGVEHSCILLRPPSYQLALRATRSWLSFFARYQLLTVKQGPALMGTVSRWRGPALAWPLGRLAIVWRTS